jgi:acetyl-CoA C-acetyltransferase
MDILICNPIRTAIGAFQGGLANLSAVDLATHLTKHILSSTGLSNDSFNELIVGSVLTAGQGQAPARQVVIKSGLAQSTHAMTINKVCSSGLKAIMLAADQIRLGDSKSVIAGGMESMSNAPYILSSLRGGARYGNTSAEDTIIKDGLWCAYNNYLMGCAAELLAKEHNISREQQDEFATESYNRAINAINSGNFKNEIIGVTAKVGKEEVTIDKDEEPFKANLAKIPTLKPAFDKSGTVTAANASSLNDGAALAIVCNEDFAKANKLTPIARIRSYATHSQQPEWFTTAPIEAVKKSVNKAGLKLSDIDLFEINEAFSCVAIACRNGLEVDASKLNVNGGAVALGHPIGASGARILVTLIHSLKRLNKKLGAVGICNGGGEATSMVVELI